MTLKSAVTNLLLMFVAATGAVLVMRVVMPPRPAPEPADVVQPSATGLQDGVCVSYLHGNYRCATCRAIEEAAREAVESGFGELLARGQLRWQVINYAEPGNERYTRDYDVVGPCVMLERFAGGRQTAWQSLPRVWELFDDKPAMVEYVQECVREFLGPASATTAERPGEPTASTAARAALLSISE